MVIKTGYGAPTIGSIALSVGFKDQSHFSRAFKARYGTSPVDYRKRRA
jgi:AraC-like DNA-binding protein